MLFANVRKTIIAAKLLDGIPAAHRLPALLRLNCIAARDIITRHRNSTYHIVVQCDIHHNTASALQDKRGTHPNALRTFPANS